MKIEKTPLEYVNVERAKYIEENRELNKMAWFGTFGLLLFAPIIFTLPLILNHLYKREPTNFDNPYKRVWHKDKYWQVWLVALNILFFMFLVFPFIPAKAPFWGFWSEFILPYFYPLVQRDFMWNLAMFLVITIPYMFFVLAFLRPYYKVKHHKFRDLVDDENHLVVPTRDDGTIVLRRINTGIMVLGAAGSGKTEFIKQLVAQFPTRDNYAWVIFDPKGDYLKEFGTKEDVVLSIRPNESTYAWNIFKEIAPKDPLKVQEKMRDVMEEVIKERSNEKEPLSLDEVIEKLKEEGISDEELAEDPYISIAQITGELFKEMTKSSQDKFWNYAAQQVLEGIIYVMYKDALEMFKEDYEEWELAMDNYEKELKEWEEDLKVAVDDKEREEMLKNKPTPPQKPLFEDYLPTNADLYDMVMKNNYATTYEMLNKYKELKLVAAYLNPQAEKMAASVWAVLGTQFRRIFQGTFGPESRRFKQISMKEYIKNPNGRRLFIEYDVSKGDVLAPIYRMLIDRLIEYSLSKGTENQRKYFIIDEFQNVPQLTLYQNLVNYGRSLNVTSVIGIQALTQVESTYGKEVTDAVVSGHRFIFAFSLGDERSRKFVSEEVGSRNIWTIRPVSVSSENPKGGSKVIGSEYNKLEYKPIEIGDIRFWKAGEVLIIAREGVKKVRLFTYGEAKPIITRFKRMIKDLRWLSKVLREKGFFGFGVFYLKKGHKAKI